MRKYLLIIVTLLTALLSISLFACSKKADTRVIVPDEEDEPAFDTTVPNGYDLHVDGVEYGSVYAFEYDSTVTGGKKRANVLLPAGYDDAKEYPIVFVYSGYDSDQNNWLDNLNAKEIFGNLIHEDKLAECIVVFVNAFMSENEESEGVSNIFAGDASCQDVVECLYPALNQVYSIKAGKENVAVAGYSAGGRYTLNVVLQYEDFADYALACEPFLYDETKCVLAGKTLKSLLVVKGAKDGIVVDAPYAVHLELQKYHVNHVYFELDFGHEPDCWKQSLYLFLNTIFKE